jgi:hypothetical protein
MCQLTHNPKHIWPSTVLVDADVFRDAYRGESECHVVLSDVVAELSCLGIIADKECPERLWWLSDGGKLNLSMVTALPKSRIRI